jgi:hypothetical protein
MEQNATFVPFYIHYSDIIQSTISWKRHECPAYPTIRKLVGGFKHVLFSISDMGIS